MSFNIHNVVVKNRDDALREFAKIGADRAGAALMVPKTRQLLFKVYDLSPKQANIIKQEMLGKGADAAVARGSADASVAKTDLLMMGTEKQYRAVFRKLRMQPFKLSKLADQLEQALINVLNRPTRTLMCRDKELILGKRTLVMGILNVTPDSFSDGGQFNTFDDALTQARRMETQGADIIDLGGESTRPGYTPISVEEELDRIIPVLKALVPQTKLPISIDTTKAEVARQALEAGAHIINDQWALRADPDMAAVVAEFKVPVILMHNQKGTKYRDVMGDMVQYFSTSIDLALSAGIDRQNIIIDPGIGFGKTAEQNIEVMRRLPELACLGLPILLGTSRKSFIGKTLDVPPQQRAFGTGATVSLGIVGGADIVRVHDVEEMVQVAKMTDVMVRG